MFETARPVYRAPDRAWEPTPTSETRSQSLRRSYKFLLRPTCKQVTALEACLEDTRQLYNAALEERREAWRRGCRVTYCTQKLQLKDIRCADPLGIGRWAYSCESAVIRRLDRAFQAFFRRVKAGETPGYPRFKGQHRWDSVEWELSHGAKWDSASHPTVTRVYLMGVGHVKVHQHRRVKGHVKTIAVKREGRRWYVVLSCDHVPAESLEPNGAAVGIDMGVASFLTTSDGAHVPNPRPLAASADRIAAAQRALLHKKRGSSRRRKAVEKVAKLHGKACRTRLDHAHKTALLLIRDHDVIACEALSIENMTRRPEPKPDPDKAGEHLPNGAAAKAGLNRSIHDAGWGNFLRVLHAKAESAGREVVAVDPRHTSQRCAECGHTERGNRVSQAAFRCLSCGHEAHADVNAAINILRAGLALREAQATREAAA